jgi:hypothetical protein
MAAGALPFCCNGSHMFSAVTMGAAVYLALVGGGLATAVAATLVLKGIKLI